MNDVILFLTAATVCHLATVYGGYYGHSHNHDKAPSSGEDERIYSSWWGDQRRPDFSNPSRPRSPFGRHDRDSRPNPLDDSNANFEDMSRPPNPALNRLPGWLNVWSTTTETTISREEEIAACMRTCFVTSEYNPVCGTDNVTYANPGRLECAQNCGVDVKISRLSSCNVPVAPDENKNVVAPNGHTSTSTSTTTQAPSWQSNSSTSSNPNIKENVDHFDNSQKDCNKGDSNTGRKPSLQEVMACTQLCPLTNEYNPVCGTDGITYANPGRLLCSQYCGLDVKVQKFSACSSTSNTNSYVQCPPTFTNPPPTGDGTVTPPTISVKACIKGCAINLEYSPVCGTNNVTYKNMDSLDCAIRCGVDVKLRSLTECPSSGDNVTPTIDSLTPPPYARVQECIKKCSVGMKYSPICGSNDVTYNNTGHLLCARQCGLDVEVKALSACSDTNKGYPTPNPLNIDNKDKVTPGPNGLNFTISPDILANIFPEDTKSTPDDSEDFDLDERFGIPEKKSK